MINVKEQFKQMDELLHATTEKLGEMLGNIEKAFSESRIPDFNEMESLDKFVDSKEKELDQLAFEYIALQSPHASDLRLAFSIIKIVTDLERIGDECKNIARPIFHGEPGIGDDLRELFSLSQQIISDAFAILDSHNPNDARTIIDQDEKIDELFHKIAGSAESSRYVFYAAKSLERIADHATNIAESVIFISEGIDIRHMK